MQFYLSTAFRVDTKLPQCEFLGVDEGIVFDPKFELMNAENLKRLEDLKVYFDYGNEVSIETKYEADFLAILILVSSHLTNKIFLLN